MSRWGEEAGPASVPAGASVRAGQRSLFSGPVVTRLLTYVGVTMLVGVLVMVAGRFMRAGFYPLPTLLVAFAVGVVWWAVTMVADWPAYERWEPASAVDPSLRVASDTRTRRVESMLSGADTKHRMSSRDVARTLSSIVTDVLVRSYGADPADPLARATGHLSPGLLDFLRSADIPDAPVRALSRRTLHSWLTEIDTLTRQRG